MASKTKSKHKSHDAVAMLTADHKKVKALFKQYAKLKDDDGSDAEKRELVETICTELMVHTAIEEEIFYPAVREAIDEEDLMDEALVEHAGAKELIEQLQGMSPQDDLYDAKVTVLGEQIDHHAGEEEDEMFPKARKAQLDLQELGVQLAERKEELKGRPAVSSSSRSAASGNSGKSRGGVGLRR